MSERAMQLFLVVALCLVATDASAQGKPKAEEAFFLKHVAPIFEQRCMSCHSDKTKKGDYSLQASATALDKELVEPGDASNSLLVEMISVIDGKAEMPQGSDPLTEKEQQLIRQWVETGAHWPEGFELSVKDTWWSRQPLKRPAVPEVPLDQQRLVRNPIDAFVLAKLNEQGMALSPQADRRILIRRVHYDLIGLPPSPEEVDQFVNDDDPKAYEKLVDRLLASPRYGEHWARHWLDVVHYADTMGFDKDKVRRNAWPYRDYVIRSFNQDKPYRRFVREQLAGDVFYPGTTDGIVGLGFIAAGPFDFVGQTEIEDGKIEKKRVQNLDRDDMVSSTMTTFVSTTADCARCHDHKFDPISQEDYYRLQAVFAAVDRAERPVDFNPEIAEKRYALQQKLDGLAQLGEANKAEVAGLKKELASLPKPGLVYAAATEFKKVARFRQTGGQPRPIFVLKRGSERAPDMQIGAVRPGALSALEHLQSHFHLPEQHDESQRRAALADWIVDDQNPLTWRSIVNRTWQYHFGRGIVDSPNDFGLMGRKPTHPELLDWLAVEFRDSGQRMKRLHRMICLSTTYRQASSHNSKYAQIDAENRFLWRMNRRRLTAESIRDSILLISGKMNERMGGPGYKAFGFKDDHSPHYKYHEYNPDDPKTHRRSIYRMAVRSVPDPLMTTLDCADPSINVAKRTETTTALQALALLNNKFTVRMAEHYAARLQAMHDKPADQIRSAFRLAIGRNTTPQEHETVMAIADEHGLANACRLIFNLNEFVFID